MTILGSKVDDLPIEEDQEELHPNVKYLGDICKEANCTGMTCHCHCHIRPKRVRHREISWHSKLIATGVITNFRFLLDQRINNFLSNFHMKILQ